MWSPEDSIRSPELLCLEISIFETELWRHTQSVPLHFSQRQVTHKSQLMPSTWNSATSLTPSSCCQWDELNFN